MSVEKNDWQYFIGNQWPLKQHFQSLSLKRILLGKMILCFQSQHR